MSDTITVRGLVATTPRHIVTSEGLAITSFRLAQATRRFDRDSGSWVGSETQWFTVSAFRSLATNTFESIQKGDRVIVTGPLKTREWENGERTGTSVEITADAIGHDLNRGTAIFTRTVAPAAETEPTPDTAD